MSNKTTKRKFEVAKGYGDQDIELPVRSTRYSAGYDFRASEDVTIKPYNKAEKTIEYSELFDRNMKITTKQTQPTIVHTGVKAKFLKGEILKIFNRSSNPIKRGLVMANGVGIIDHDYYGNETNDGEIMGQFYNFGDEPITIHKGDKIMQGIFEKYLVTDDDNANGTRKGGFGSMGK